MSAKLFRHTASFYGIALATLLAIGRRRAQAGVALLLVGFGYAGVQLERALNDDLRRWRELRPAHFELDQWLYHAALAPLGYRMLTRA